MPAKTPDARYFLALADRCMALARDTADFGAREQFRVLATEFADMADRLLQTERNTRRWLWW